MGGRTGLATICGGSTIRRNLPTISWLGAEKTFVISFIVIIYSDEQVLETPHEALRERERERERDAVGQGEALVDGDAVFFVAAGIERIGKKDGKENEFLYMLFLSLGIISRKSD